MAKVGRPKIEMDWTIFETACKLMATKNEILNLMGLKEATLDRRIREKYNDSFEGILKKLSFGTKLSLRRFQFQLAEKNPAMAIWLGKQYLGQRDIPEQEKIIETGNPDRKKLEKFAAENGLSLDEFCNREGINLDDFDEE